MQRRRSRFELGLALVLFGFLVQPVPVASQCLVTNTMVVPATSMSAYTKVYKYLNGSYVCSLVMSNNASLCAPGSAMLRTMLTASAASGATNPSCSFNCAGGCGSIVINSSDGLPVELMDFSVED